MPLESGSFLLCHPKKPSVCRSEKHLWKTVNCGIYANRPSIWQKFAISGEVWEINETCNRAHALGGLPVLYKDMLFHTCPDAATERLTRVQLPAN
ncbi:putative ferredoxin [Escherichia marmotae]|nr:putative ferredoxin [Escherichia marmotae]